MATLKELRLKLRNAKNHIIGKQHIIDEYNALESQICSISDNMHKEDPLKQYVMRNLLKIREERLMFADTTFSAFYVVSYNPWKGTKSKTQRKIQEYKQLLRTINDAGQYSPNQR